MARHLEKIGEKVAQNAGDLGLRRQGQQSAPTIVFRETESALEGEGRLAVEPETVAQKAD